MEKKKILIFEDEWVTIRGSFEMANIYAFEGSLEFEVKVKSQDASFDPWEDKYSAVFIDITLAKNTKLDGYNIFRKIKESKLIDLKRVVILTGNSKIIEKLKEMQIYDEQVTIIYKPLDFVVLSTCLMKILNP